MPNACVILPSDPPPCGPGPYGYLVIPPGLNEESWTLESDPITEKERTEGYKCVALYARVDVAPEPGRVTAEMLEAAARAILKAEWEVAGETPEDAAWIADAIIDGIADDCEDDALAARMAARAAFEAIGLTVEG